MKIISKFNIREYKGRDVPSEARHVEAKSKLLLLTKSKLTSLKYISQFKEFLVHR